MSNVIVAPSILAADFLNIGASVRQIEESGAEYLHIDVMDGVFVPNISFGCGLLSAIRSKTRLTLDVHLMIDQPERYIDDFVKAGADILTVHLEASRHLHRTLTRIRELGALSGVALNPATPIDGLKHVWNVIDLLLIMSVNPGFGGQRFIPSALDKIRDARAVYGGLIEVDGGVDKRTAPSIIGAGANVLVTGSAFFASDNRAEFVRALKEST